MKWNNLYEKTPRLIYNIDGDEEDETSELASDQVIFKINNKYYIGVYTKERYGDDDIKWHYGIEFPLYSWIPLNSIFGNIKINDLEVRDGILSLEDLREDEMKSILWKEIE